MPSEEQSLPLNIRTWRHPVNRGTSLSGIAWRVALVSLGAAGTMLVALACQCAAAEAGDGLPSRALKDSPSLYLREAVESPVRWQSWGTESFALARKLNRPLLLDIGAVWCHWCHVMDEVTYTDAHVAEVINRNFVPIKIDRDQRPDLDQYYQRAAAELTGASGWPLTCFVFPDGKLFLAFGYMPPAAGEGQAGMSRTLEHIAEAWRSHRGE